MYSSSESPLLPRGVRCRLILLSFGCLLWPNFAVALVVTDVTLEPPHFDSGVCYGSRIGIRATYVADHEKISVQTFDATGTRIGITGTSDRDGAVSERFDTIISDRRVTNPVRKVPFTVRLVDPNGVTKGAITYDPSLAGITSCPPSETSDDDSARDTEKLRSLQVGGTQTAAQAAVGAYSNILSSVVGEAFTTPNVSQQPTFNLDASGMFEGASALGMSPGALDWQGQRSRTLQGFPMRVWARSRLIGTGGENSLASLGEIDWRLLMVVSGADFRMAPDLIVGTFGGYETFRYSRNDIAGKLSGDGPTIGAYLAWMLFPGVRFDTAVGHSWISYDGTAGSASGSFDGDRWLFSGNLTGTYSVGQIILEPSAQVYWLHEEQDSYTDSLNALQPEFGFTLGRASVGGRASFSMLVSRHLLLIPYAGIYADDYFAFNDAVIATVPEFGLSQGWSARVTGGATLATDETWSLTAGGEAGNLGSGAGTIWTGQLGGSLKF